MSKIARKHDFASASEVAPSGSEDKQGVMARLSDPVRAETRPQEAPEGPPSPVMPSGPAAGDMGKSGKEGAKSGSKRRRVRLMLFALLPLLLAVGGYFYVTGGAVMSTDNAYVRSNIVSVSTDVSGIVRSIDVHDNERVKKGQVLFQLDPLPYKLALEKADGMVGIAAAQLGALKTAYEDMQAQIAQQKMDITYYQRDFDRKKSLVKRSFASQADYDTALHNLQDAQQKLASLKAELAGDAAKLDGHPDWPVTKLSGYLYAVSQRDEAARQLRHTTVRAPFDGVVTNVPSLQVGQSLPASTPAFSLVATHHVWVEADPKETQLTYVRPGQAVTIYVDTYPDVTWKGTVNSISPASSSSFSLLPAQNTSGNWVKVVQRIPLKIDVETTAGKPPLRAGMSVEVEVDTGHARGLPHFLTRLFGWSLASAPAKQPAALTPVQPGQSGAPNG